MAYYDSIILAGNIYAFSIPTWLKLNYEDLRIYVNGYTFSLWNFTHTSCIYLVVLVSLERYMMLCQPERAKQLCTPTKIKLYTIAISVFSLGFNFPVFFALKWDTSASNETSLGSTDFSCTWTYQVVYATILVLIVRQVMPLVCILTTNYHLFSKVCLDQTF